VPVPSRQSPIRQVASAIGKGPWQVELRPVGSQSVLIVDDFYSDVEVVRELALSLDFVDEDKLAKYPGMRASISIDLLGLYQDLLDTYMDARGTRRVPVGNFRSGPLVFSRFTNEVRLLRADQTVPHIDVGSAFAATVFLNPPDQCRGGTFFYRHRETGIDHLPHPPTADVAGAMRARGYDPVQLAEYYRFIREVFSARAPSREELDGCSGLIADNEHWEIVGRCEMRCNRVVLAPGSLFHSAIVREGDFGDTQETARLTQNIFFTP
jgi:Family of unknown function (DUF6445)